MTSQLSYFATTLESSQRQRGAARTRITRDLDVSRWARRARRNGLLRHAPMTASSSEVAR